MRLISTITPSRCATCTCASLPHLQTMSDSNCKDSSCTFGFGCFSLARISRIALPHSELRKEDSQSEMFALR